MNIKPAMQPTQRPITQPSTSAKPDPIRAKPFSPGKPPPEQPGADFKPLSKRSIKTGRFAKATSSLIARFERASKTDDTGNINKSPGSSQQPFLANPAKVREGPIAEEPEASATVPTAQHITRHKHQKKSSQHPLLSACQSGDIDTVKKLRSESPNLVNQSLEHLKQQTATPLIIAIENGKENVMNELLENWGADPNLTTNTGTSPLLAAVKNLRVNTSAVETLLKYNARVNHQDNLGETPLMAISRNKEPTHVLPPVPNCL